MHARTAVAKAGTPGTRGYGQVPYLAKCPARENRRGDPLNNLWIMQIAFG